MPLTPANAARMACDRPFLGIRSAFADHEIDETIIQADQFLFIDRFLMVLLLEEDARFSKRVVLLRGPRFDAPSLVFAHATLTGIVGRVRFEALSWQ